MDALEIHLQSVSFRCPNCKKTVHIKDYSLIEHSRQHSFEHNKGHVRCEDCGFRIEYSFEGDLVLKTEVKGLSCGVCGKVVNELYDGYFCKEHYIKHLTEEAKRWSKLSEEELNKIKALDES